jgi:ribonuclease HII
VRIESLLWGRGVHAIAGIDEAGRGAWAGPVVAAAVILPPEPDALTSLLTAPLNCDDAFAGVRDSKCLSPEQRCAALPRIQAVALAIGTGIVPPQIVDDLGLSFAGQLAFWRAVQGLQRRPDYLLVDGFPLWSPCIQQASVLQGDARCLSIAAASIVAKVTRDRMMACIDSEAPGYGFSHNVGYGTPSHAAALRRLGPSAHHRLTWQPVAAVFGGGVVQAQDPEEMEA